jgi:glyoxylase-like metal-dependent hydrolase (beta-lactamase superfamily II)
MSRAIAFEVSNKPWFGPRKRAREFLRNRREILPPGDARQSIADLSEPLGAGIQKIRFIDFCHKDEDNFRYTIALVWTYSDASIRNWLYDNAAKVVAGTGWYPLPQGERIGSRLADRDFEHVGLANASTAALNINGPLSSIANAVSQDGGCSIRCNAAQDSFLLDTGLPGKLSVASTDRLVFLTHSHLDHCGNIREVFRSGLPVIMSRATARILSVLGRATDLELRRYCMFLDVGQELALGDGLNVRSFSVPHCPGSMGFTFGDGDTTLVYPGDVTFQTSRHDAVPAIIQQINSSAAANRVCLIDATMAGRDLGAASHNVADDTLKALDKYEDIVIVSNDVEQLLYAYLDLYHTGKEGQSRGTVEFVVSAELRRVFEVLHSDFIFRNLTQTDPFLSSQYRESMSSWAENRWLFWLEERLNLSTQGSHRRIWLVPSAELAAIRPTGKTGLIPIGRAEDAALDAPFPFDRLSVDSSPWTLHSDESCLQKVKHEVMRHAKVVLFHNFVRRLKKFANGAGLSCDALGQDVIPLQ